MSPENQLPTPENSGEQAPKPLLERLAELYQAANEAEARAEDLDRSSREQAANYANRMRGGHADDAAKETLIEIVQRSLDANHEVYRQRDILAEELQKLIGQRVRFSGTTTYREVDPTVRLAAPARRVTLQVKDGEASVLGQYSTPFGHDKVGLVLLDKSGRTLRMDLDKVEALEIAE